MALYTPTILAFWLGDVVVNFRQGETVPRCSGGIKLLDESSSVLRADCLYICTAQSLERAIASGRLPPDALFAICSGEYKLEIPGSLTLIETSLPLIELYNCVQELVHRFTAWDSEIQRAIYRNAGLQEILNIASSELHTTIFLVNAGYKHVASVYCPEVHDFTADELRSNGYLSFETIQRAHDTTAIRGGIRGKFAEYVSPVSRNYTIVHLIRRQSTLAGRLCVILNGADANNCYCALAAILADYILEYMFSNQGADYSSNADLGSLVADLIECRLTDPVELEQRLKQVKLAVRRYYHVVIVSFDASEDRSNISWGYIISQLEQIFPYSNITTYRGEILMLVRKTNRGRLLSFNTEKLLKLLDHYSGYAVIGNTSEFLTSLPPVYYQVKDALRLGKVMTPGQRILYYEDYSMYQMIEFASESARQHLGSRNLAHLCNNETIALLLHDTKTGSNLLEFLHTYLQHERNVTETAKALYIHRNTAQYKIHKIEELIGGTLDDPILRERLLFSYHVLEYMTRYCKEDILVLKRNQSEGVQSSSER